MAIIRTLYGEKLISPHHIWRIVGPRPTLRQSGKEWFYVITEISGKEPEIRQDGWEAGFYEISPYFETPYTLVGVIAGQRLVWRWHDPEGGGLIEDISGEIP
jgi:hypothetical protein